MSTDSSGFRYDTFTGYICRINILLIINHDSLQATIIENSRQSCSKLQHFQAPFTPQTLEDFPCQQASVGISTQKYEERIFSQEEVG